MISKELLSEVLNKKVIDDDISNIELKENTITFIEDYWDEDEGSGFYRNHTINIYELANICKEWAKNKGYNILSGYDGSDTPEALVDHTYSEGGCYCTESFKANTEPESVLKACQWILDNVKTNSLS